LPKYFLGMRFGGLLLLLLTMSSSQVDAMMEEPTCAVESCGAECIDVAKCPMPGCLMPLAHYCTDCLSGTAMFEGTNVSCCPNCSMQLKTPAKKKKPKPKKRKKPAGSGRQGGTSALSLMDSGLLAALKAKVKAEDWTLTAIEGWFSSPPMPRGCDVPYSGSCLVRQQIRAALSGDRVAPNTVGAMQFWLSDGLKEQPEPIIETPRVPATPKAHVVSEELRTTVQREGSHGGTMAKFLNHFQRVMSQPPKGWEWVFSPHSVSLRMDPFASLEIDMPGSEPKFLVHGRQTRLPLDAFDGLAFPHEPVKAAHALQAFASKLHICRGKEWDTFPECAAGAASGAEMLGKPAPANARYHFRVMENKPFAIRNDCELFATDRGRGKSLFVCKQCQKIVKPKEGGSGTSAPLQPHKSCRNAFMTKEQIAKKARLNAEATTRWKTKAKKMKDILDREGISLNGEPESEARLVESAIGQIEQLFAGDDKKAVKEFVLDQVKYNRAGLAANISPRWSPAVIRLGLTLGQSSKQYLQMRDMFKLPGIRTLDNYTSWISTEDGIHHDILGHYAKHVMESKDPKAAVMGGLAHDGMKIKKGLVLGRNGELQGIVEPTHSEIFKDLEDEMSGASATKGLLVEGTCCCCCCCCCCCFCEVELNFWFSFCEVELYFWFSFCEAEL
jgi:hypothetical protein